MKNEKPKTFVYIDGFNLYYGAIKGTPFKWLDFPRLCQTLLPNDQIEHIKYFTSLVRSTPTNPDAPIVQQIYLRALRTIPHISIYLGQFLTHPCRRPITGSNPTKWVRVDNTQEKGSDVNLAAHLLHDGFLGLYETAVLITNDSDLREPVRMVREVLKLPVGILNSHPTHSKEFQEYATFKKRIRSGHLNNSQFPNKLTDSEGDFEKPAKW